MPLVSIVMTAYNRAYQLNKTLESIFCQKYDYEVIVAEDGADGGHTKEVCSKFPVKYFQRIKRPEVAWSNPSILNNFAIRQATGKVLIIQNAEVMHTNNESIKLMTEPVLEDKTISQFASCLARNQFGKDDYWYCHPTINPRPLFFCQSVDKEVVLKMRGFDEEFIHYGYEDDDFADRLKLMGIKFVFREDILTIHQYHETCKNLNEKNNKELYLKKKGTNPIRNIDKEWGKINEEKSNKFDKIFYINLEKRKDKKLFMDMQLNKCNIKAERFNAFELKEPDPVFCPKSDDKNLLRLHSCFMSHYKVLEQSIGCKNILILEDDVTFHPNFNEHINNILPELDKWGWDFLFLNYGEKYKDYPYFDQLHKGIFGAYGYAVNGEFIPKLLDVLKQSHYLKNLETIYPIDDIYASILKARFYGTKLVTHQTIGQSDTLFYGLNVDPYGSHIPILSWAVVNSNGPIVELGCGNYSTPLLHAIAQNRPIYSFETNDSWLSQFRDLKTNNHQFFNNNGLEFIKNNKFGVAFIDGDANTRRKAIELLKDNANLIVVHDTNAEEIYNFREIFKQFKYVEYHFRMFPWTTILSNIKEINCPMCLKF